jgi:hypothetical protein
MAVKTSGWAAIGEVEVQAQWARTEEIAMRTDEQIVANADVLVSHKELCAQVRILRRERALTRDHDQRRSIGRSLYECQVELKARFGIDIAKVR